MKNPFKPFQEFLTDFEYSLLLNNHTDEELQKVSLVSAYKLAAYILDVKDSKLNKELLTIFSNHELNILQIIINYLDLNYPIFINTNNSFQQKKKRETSIKVRIDFIKKLHDEGIIDDGTYTYLKLQHL